MEQNEELIVENPRISKYAVWSMLSRRQAISRFKDLLEPETFIQLEILAKEISEQFSETERGLLRELTAIDFDAKPESVISEIEKSDNKDILLMMLHGEDYAPLIWNLIRPERPHEQ